MVLDPPLLIGDVKVRVLTVMHVEAASVRLVIVVRQAVDGRAVSRVQDPVDVKLHRLLLSTVRGCWGGARDNGRTLNCTDLKRKSII